MPTDLRTELRKLTTVRAPALLLAAAVAIAAVGSVTRLARHPEDASGAAAHAGLAGLFALVLGIMAVSGEYRHRTIADTYLSTPARGRVLLAKLIVNTAAGAVFGLAAAAATLLAVLVQSSASVPWSALAGAVAWNAAFAAIGVGLGAIVRNQVAAIAGALAWLALVEGVAAEALGDDAARWLPLRAAAALGGMSAAGGLSQGTAGLVLAGYVLTAFGVGLAVRHRDAL